MFYCLKIGKIEKYTQGKSDQPIKSDMRTYYNIWKITAGQGDDYTSAYLLDYNYFNNYNKMIAINLSMQQALDADLKAIEQINFTGNLDWAKGTTLFLVIEEAKKTF